MQVPRYTYLPLLIPEIRDNFVDLVLTEKEEEGTMQGLDEREWWFEEEDSGTFTSQGPCKWYVALLPTIREREGPRFLTKARKLTVGTGH